MAYNKTPFKMYGKSPMMKALVGKQGNLPMHLQEKILASPAKQTKDKPSKLPNLGNKNASMGTDGKMTIISSKMRKNKPDFPRAKKMEPEAVQPAKKKAVKKSPAKKYGKSPVKQTDTKIKDIPKVLENTGKKVLEKGKKVIKDIGNITLSSKERKACKEKGGIFKKGKCHMPDSPAKKKGCKYGKSPAKQKFIPEGTPKSKKEMRYDKTAQKAENAAVKGKVRKNSRLVNKANKMNKKNNLGKGKIAKM